MGSYQRGTTITLEAHFTDGRTGTYTDPDSGTKSLVVYKDGVAILTVPDGSILKYDTGKYYYNWETSIALEKGLYVYEYSAEFGGDVAKESGLVRIRQRKVG